MKPPSHIDGAVVLEWAWSDQPFGYLHASDGSGAIAIHGLAIARYSDSGELYRFSCNSSWETEQDSRYDSVESAKDLLPEQYREVPPMWLKA